MKQKTYVQFSIAVIILVAIIRVIFALTHTVSGDACWHLSSARFIATNNQVPLFEGLGRLQPFWAPPVFHFIAAFFYKIFMLFSPNLADLSLRLVSPILGTLTVIILYFISRRLFDEKIAFYSMVFINFVPLFLDYSIFSYVGSTVTFFSILSVYLMLSNRYILSSISLGLAILSKYNAVFIVPMLLYLAYKLSSNKKEGLLRAFVVGFLSLLVSSVWFLRNLILLGNPFWPFLNDIFPGIKMGTSFSTTNFGQLFSFETYLRSYLEIFGIPNGNLESLSFLNFPLLNFFIFVWLIGTLIFAYPFIKSFFKVSIEDKKKKYFIRAIYISFVSFLFMFVLYVLSLGWFGSRLLLPVLPFIAIMWAIGIGSLKIERPYLIIVIIIGLGFITAEGIKLSVASNEWGKFDSDFQWARSNTIQEDIFYGNGQCLSYNINRIVVPHVLPLDSDKVDYVFTNNRWMIDFPIDGESLSRIKSNSKLALVYNNTDTGTLIYKVR
jgi:4-amino-4-deoxy-L-arabinose transferase-like glycosyltransferase